MPGFPARVAPHKTAYFVLEGFNSFATAYYFNYLLFLLRDEYGFSNEKNLAVAALHGLVYIPASIYGGRFGQRHGNFPALRVGFAGMVLGIAVGWAVPALWGQCLALAIWTVCLCFTWPMLEALVSENEPPDQLPNRVGLYNVVWAGTAAVGYAAGGWLFQRLGRDSLYWLPLAIHFGQFVSTWSLERRHRRSSPVPDPGTRPERAGADELRDSHFQRLAWLANPFNYMAINTVAAMAPGLAGRMGLGLAEAGLVFSVWFHVRALAFLKLWLWPGWHYRFSWYIGAFGILLASFVVLVMARQLPLILAAQVGLGWASALLYYSSLYYAMDGSSAPSEHGGIHEALIGVGICGGPALCAVAQTITGSAAAPAWVIMGVLAVGMGAAMRIHRSGRRSR